MEDVLDQPLVDFIPEIPPKIAETYIRIALGVVARSKQVNIHFDGCQLCWAEEGHTDECPMGLLEELEAKHGLESKYQREQ